MLLVMMVSCVTMFFQSAHHITQFFRVLFLVCGWESGVSLCIICAEV